MNPFKAQESRGLCANVLGLLIRNTRIANCEIIFIFAAVKTEKIENAFAELWYDRD